MSNSNQGAIVTGGSRGIGRAIALRLAADGFAVLVNYVSDEQQAERTVQDILAAGGRASAEQGDVADPADVARMFDVAQERFGEIKVVANSAGVMPLLPILPQDAAGLERFDRVIRTNLRGAYLVLGQAAARLQRGGRIIALSTSVIPMAFPGYGPYIASKAGVECFVRVLANELRGRGITVNAVAPGPVGTDLFLAGKTEEQLARISNMPPLEQRLGTPEEMAAAVSFLAGPEGAWVNAQVLRVNGGFA